MQIILSLLLLCSSAYAQTTPIASSYRDFSGGLNTDDASVSLQPNESPNLLNVVIDERGSLTQRKGYLTCGNTPSGNTPSGNTATNLYEYSKNNGSRNLILTDNITIWQTPDCVQFTTITTGLNSLDLPRFATVQDKLWAVNGSTWPMVWDGTTLTLLDGSSASRPTGPKGRLITYWKSRVWIGNTTTEPSGLYFSATTDANGNILDPATSTGAWSNTANLIYFNRDNGSPLYAIKVYRDNLYAFKENDILRLVFESEYTAGGVTVTKTASKTGSKFQESIVEMDDGLLRFVGRDGVYAFDGSMVKRVSDKWTPTFYTIKQPSHAEQYKLWDTATDWAYGQLSSIHSVGGNLSLISTFGFVNSGFESNNFNNWTVTGSWSIDTSAPPFGTYWAKADSCISGFRSICIYDTDNVLLNSAEGLLDVGYGEIDTSTITVNYKIKFGPGATCSAVSNPSIQSGLYEPGNKVIYHIQSTGAGCTSPARHARLDLLEGRRYTTPGTFTSQISTATGLTLWKTFDADSTLNGQTIAYLIRTATSVYNMAAAAYRDITPGSNVSSTTANYVQWKATFTTTDNGVTPILNSASIGWVTGDSSKSPITAQAYKSRYWLSASTTVGNDYNDMTMVNSKSPTVASWTKFDLPLSAMTLWNNNLYGAIGNTSKIARIDYGDTDDGTAITSYWDSPDDVYGNPLLYKSINRQIVDFASTPANDTIKVGLSNDLGNTWSYVTFNTAKNPSLIRNTQIINMSANNMLQFRSRIYNNKLGIGYTIYGLHGLGTAGSFAGN